MNLTFALAVLAVLCGCATQPQTASSTDTEAAASEQVAATRSFLAENNARPMDWIYLRGTMKVLGSNEWFAEIQTEDGRYLLETDRPCRALTVRGNDGGVEFIGRQSSSGALARRLVPGVDYIRNCRIAAIYDLNAIAGGTDDSQPVPTNGEE